MATTDYVIARHVVCLDIERGYTIPPKAGETMHHALHYAEQHGRYPNTPTLARIAGIQVPSLVSRETPLFECGKCSRHPDRSIRANRDSDDGVHLFEAGAA